MADINSFLSENLPVVGYRDQGGREIRPTGDDLSELQGSYADGLISSDQLIFEGISTPGKNGVSPADTADNNRSVRIPGDMDDMDPMFDELQVGLMTTILQVLTLKTTQLTTVHGEQRSVTPS